jgi:protein-disulfide isomerase
MWKKIVIAAAAACLIVAGIAYYNLFAWSSGFFAASRGTDESGLPWIGAAAPELVIHEYVDYECPHCVVVHQYLRRALLFHQGSVRLVRHDYARMPCRAGLPGQPPRSCELVRAGFCAADQGAFWKWNDAVVSSPRPLKNPGRDSYMVDKARELGLDVGAFEKCLVAQATIDRAQAIYEEARKRRISETPTYVVDGKKLDVKELFALLGERL